MLFRMSHYTARQLYDHYNMDDERWPDLPPPPNPEGLKSFVEWCLSRTIEQMNEENDPENAKNAANGRRQMTP